MIQSGKFDSSNMDIKKLANSVLIFVINRLIEIIGILVSFFGVLLFVALISYSSSDPNFIFPDNTEIKNLLGFQGSYISDLFFQSIGLVSFLISFTFFFTGINIFKKKEIFLLVENTFFIIIYTLISSLFLSFYYQDSFSLYINGNGGFVGNFLNETFLNQFISLYENIFFYTFVALIIIVFLISINFNMRNFFFIN